jgi:hypothetical protein
MKDTAPTDAVGCIIDAGQEAKMEFRAQTQTLAADDSRSVGVANGPEQRSNEHMRTRSRIAVLMAALVLWGTVPYRAAGQDRPTADPSPPAGQGEPKAKKSKKAGAALLVTGMALAAGGSYLVKTWKIEESGSMMNCPTPHCTPGQFCPTYCYSDYQYNDHPWRLRVGVGLIGAGAVAVIAGIRRLR